MTHGDGSSPVCDSPGCLSTIPDRPDGRAWSGSTVSRVAAAADAVEAEVRELVRRRGLDPIADRVAMRRLVDEVVSDYDDRSLTSSLPTLPNPVLAALASTRRRGVRPAAAPLDDPEVEEIWINERLTVG